MPKISAPIRERKFEVVKASVASILIDELTAQHVLQPDEEALKDIRVFEEIDGLPVISAMPAVVINHHKTDFQIGAIMSGEIEGRSIFYLHCYHQLPTSVDHSHHSLARTNVIRMMGVIQAILSDPKYKTLSFDAKDQFVSRVYLSKLELIDTISWADTHFVAMGKLTLEVDTKELVELDTAVQLQKINTIAKLVETDIGYEYILN